MRNILKKEIIERLTLENDIRKQLFSSSDSEKDSKSWINSNIAILLIGFILSGILIPIFQFNQKRIEWNRQNQYENYKANIENKETFLKEFIFLSSLTSEMLELSSDILKNNNVTISSYSEYEFLFNKLQSKRFKQNAKILFLLIFIDNQKINSMFKKFIIESDKYIKNIKLEIKKHCESPGSVKEKEWKDLGATIIPINELYEDITDRVFIEIERIKDENKKLHM